MHPSAFRYHRPASLDRAIELLAAAGEQGRVLAGGQSLIPMMKLRLANPAELIDLEGIAALSQLSVSGGMVHAGALVRHRTFEYGALPTSLPILRDAAAVIADQQVRNRGTMGGSIANADPGGDWAPVLLVCGAEVDVAGPAGARTIPIAGFFADSYTTTLEANEIIRRINIPIPGPRSGNGYVAFKVRTGDFAVASAAARVDLDASGRYGDAAIALGNAAATAILVETASGILRGGDPADEELAAQAGAAAAEACDPFEDSHGSADYRRSLVRTLVTRALDLATRRARGEHVDADCYH